MEKIILASSSPRRLEIFKGNGKDPTVLIPHVDETVPPALSPETAVMFLALKKSLAAEELLNSQGFENTHKYIIVAADTIVVHEGTILGKPSDKNDARLMLSSLSGKSHLVMTGVSLIRPETTSRKVFFDTSLVHFKTYSKEDLEAYINTSEPYDKAGGYAIQGTFSKYVDFFEGDIDNIIGFPWKKFLKEVIDF